MIFNYCLNKANFTERDKVESEGFDFEYCVDIVYEEEILQSMVIFTVNVHYPESTMFYCFGLPEVFDLLQISICEYKNGQTTEIHTSMIESEDELEARLFQIYTQVDIYDLDVSLLKKMLSLREVYLNKKNETELKNLV